MGRESRYTRYYVEEISGHWGRLTDDHYQWKVPDTKGHTKGHKGYLKGPDTKGPDTTHIIMATEL